MRLPVLIALLAGLWATTTATGVRAETYNTCKGFITTVPAVITTQGTWCLKQDIATAITAGAAIDIKVNNVTIDCNGFKLGGLAAGTASKAQGIHALDRANATIRNCTIRGFYQGVLLEGASTSGGHMVENNRVDQSLQTGIQVEGDGSTVRSNVIFDTGGADGQTSAHGLIARYTVDVIDNTVAFVISLQDPYGMAIIGNVGGVVSGNRIRGFGSVNGYYSRIGIFANSNSQAILRDNIIVAYGNTTATWGVYCQAGSGTGTVIRDNTIQAFGTVQKDCVDAGGNG